MIKLAIPWCLFVMRPTNVYPGNFRNIFFPNVFPTVKLLSPRFEGYWFINVKHGSSEDLDIELHKYSTLTYGS